MDQQDNGLLDGQLSAMGGWAMGRPCEVTKTDTLSPFTRAIHLLAELTHGRVVVGP